MPHKRKIAVIGLGYVGLQVAIAFGKQKKVIGFDISTKRIEQLREYHDKNNEVDSESLKQSHIYFTDQPNDLKEADFFIIAVPTPIKTLHQPDLAHLLNASKIVGGQLKNGDIVTYESTVYPGATEEDCLPVLEEFSLLKAGKDFFIGYSPERINPGDKINTFFTITKIVSAQNNSTLEIVAQVYGSVVNQIYKAPSIKVAEAAKIIENTQRDINIAYMNELSMIFNQIGIKTQEVLKAANTKWNFSPFHPGLVGGHCIGVDPYYLAHKAIKYGYHPEIILAGRRINDNMGAYIATQIIKQMVKTSTAIKDARIALLGLTFKENCSDLRNSKAFDILRELNSYGISPLVHDPIADPKEAWENYQVKLSLLEDIKNLDMLIIAVGHQQYKELTTDQIMEKLKPEAHLMDIKSLFAASQFPETTIHYWSL